MRVAAIYPGPAVFVSAVEPGGLEALRDGLHERLRARRPAVRLEIDARDGQSLATVYRDGEVLSREDGDGAVRLLARVPEATLGRLRLRGVRVEEAP